jgi:hypothetical protein
VDLDFAGTSNRKDLRQYSEPIIAGTRAGQGCVPILATMIINKPVTRVSNILLALFLASTAFASPVMAQRNYCEIVNGLDGLDCYDLANY